jgi:uncharacterized membrane protein (UPF0127 family)
MFLSPLVSNPEAPHHLVNVDRGTVLATRIEPAFESAARNRGLLGRDGLLPGSAMVIAPSNSVHMFFMRFPLDIVFVAKDGTVVKTCPNLRPWRIAMAWRAFAVVEGPVGMIGQTSTRPGDRIAVRDPGERGEAPDDVD